MRSSGVDERETSVLVSRHDTRVTVIVEHVGDEATFSPRLGGRETITDIIGTLIRDTADRDTRVVGVGVVGVTLDGVTVVNGAGTFTTRSGNEVFLAVGDRREITLTACIVTSRPSDVISTGEVSVNKGRAFGTGSGPLITSLGLTRATRTTTVDVGLISVLHTVVTSTRGRAGTTAVDSFFTIILDVVGALAGTIGTG